MAGCRKVNLKKVGVFITFEQFITSSLNIDESHLLFMVVKG